MARRNFKREPPNRPYRKLFILAVEGYKTEPEYFNLLNSVFSTVQIKCLKDKHKTSPENICKRMMDYIKKQGIKKTDEAWLVLDVDNSPSDSFSELCIWSLSAENYGLAISNPKFEYWLLLHFEDGNDITSPHDCSNKLKRHIPNYDKGIPAEKITTKRINEAINRAKKRDIPPCSEWPQQFGVTTVYKLVEKIIKNN